MHRTRNYRELRESLAKKFDNKCSYCGSPLWLTDIGAIEHFYPKSRYPDKVLDPENLLFACNICNASKSDKFPLDEDGYATPLTKKGETTIAILNLNRTQLVVGRLPGPYGRVAVQKP